jgi:hypothetical protein
MLKWPTDEQLDRAAELVARVAGIPDLDRGSVILPAETLDRVLRWEEEREELGGNPTSEICVELPFSYDDERRLHAAARRRVVMALGDRQDELANWVEVHRETGKREDADRFAALMYEGVPS